MINNQNDKNSAMRPPNRTQYASTKRTFLHATVMLDPTDWDRNVIELVVSTPRKFLAFGRSSGRRAHKAVRVQTQQTKERI